MTGRFINADDIAILDESKDMINGLNLYSYCGNNPVMRTDPTGRAWWHWLVGALVIVVAAVVVVATAGAAGVGIGAAFAAGFTGTAVGTGVAGAAVGIASGIFAGAVIGGGIGLLSGAITTGISTGDWSFNNLMDGASKGFMWGAIGGAVSGGTSALGGTMLKQGIAQGISQMGVYGVRTAAEREQFTILGLLSAGFSGFAGGSLFKTPWHLQLTVNGLLAIQDIAITGLKKNLSNTWVEKFVNNLFGKKAWNTIW